MAHRGWQLGYSVRIHPYAFRRKAATDLVGRIGIALTKHIMGHALEQSKFAVARPNLLPNT